MAWSHGVIPTCGSVSNVAVSPGDKTGDGGRDEEEGVGAGNDPTGWTGRLTPHPVSKSPTSGGAIQATRMVDLDNLI